MKKILIITLMLLVLISCGKKESRRQDELKRDIIIIFFDNFHANGIIKEVTVKIATIHRERDISIYFLCAIFMDKFAEEQDDVMDFLNLLYSTPKISLRSAFNISFYNVSSCDELVENRANDRWIFYVNMGKKMQRFYEENK